MSYSEQEQDLILISPDANPPVCRLMAFSKFKYQQEKMKKEATKKQRENK
jgi:translation initiation factor IF-3